MSRSSRSHTNRHVALCYIRKSWTRDDKDSISPERQRSHIQAVCERHGWTPEWYEDTDGHRSGMHEKNRPGWLALKVRLDDPDVAALVANDLSRLHRKGWRIGDLLDFVEQHGIALVLADPSRQLDFSSPLGRMMAQLSAIFDEWYAADISQRWKSSISHRKSRGITVGLPPFGTVRDKQTGFLKPSPDGAWLLPDGSWAAGQAGEQPPHPNALWRGYYDCARQILTLYAEQGKRGRICQRLQDEGWAFRNRQGEPAPIEPDDIRRVVANWAEYGGYVSTRRARERHPSDFPPDEILQQLNPERAVFPLPLLTLVARSRQERAVGKHPARSVNNRARAYPLAGITYCAQCQHLADEQQNPRYRSLLSGAYGTTYRHKPGAHCGCTRRSVSRELIEDQFRRIIHALEIEPGYLDLLSQMALRLNQPSEDKRDLERQKAEAIALCQRRIQAAVDLYGDGRISREEYHRRVELNERELLSWQARTTESEQLAVELSMCIQAVEAMKSLWDSCSDDDRQGMARHLFEYIVFDLDLQQIVDFRLKPWAEQFMQARVLLYLEEGYGESYERNPVTPTGLGGARQSILILCVWPSRFYSISSSATPTILCLYSSASIRKSAIA